MNPLIAVPLMISAKLLITSLFCEGNILCFSHVVCKQCKQNCLISLKAHVHPKYIALPVV